MKKLILIILLAAPLLFAGDINGSFRSGAFLGSGLWSQNDFSDKDEIQYDYPNLRFVNQIRLNGRFGQFSFRVNALHSLGLANDATKLNAGLPADTTISTAKIYEAFGQYDFSHGFVKLGRISSFNRWYWGSFDGGAVEYKLTKVYRISLFGGLGVPYGKWYDSDNAKALAYFDLSYRKQTFGLKIKTMYREEATKTGIDFWGRFNNLRLSGDYGYDLTNARIADGGLNLFYQATPQLVLSGNYRLFRSEPWDFPRLDFSYLIERFIVTARYTFSNGYYVSAKQVASMNSDYKNYITYLFAGNRYIYAGLNYLSSDYDISRLGISLGGKYEIIKDLWIQGALSPIDYKTYGSTDHIYTLASYLKLRYSFLDHFMVGTFWGLYNDLGTADTIDEKYRDTKLRGQVYFRITF